MLSFIDACFSVPLMKMNDTFCFLVRRSFFFKNERPSSSAAIVFFFPCSSPSRPPSFESDWLIFLFFFFFFFCERARDGSEWDDDLEALLLHLLLLLPSFFFFSFTDQHTRTKYWGGQKKKEKETKSEQRLGWKLKRPGTAENRWRPRTSAKKKGRTRRKKEGKMKQDDDDDDDDDGDHPHITGPWDSEERAVTVNKKGDWSVRRKNIKTRPRYPTCCRLQLHGNAKKNIINTTSNRQNMTFVVRKCIGIDSPSSFGTRGSQQLVFTFHKKLQPLESDELKSFTEKCFMNFVFYQMMFISLWWRFKNEVPFVNKIYGCFICMNYYYIQQLVFTF